ncbi:MAG TPA: serpin family protein [Gemmatimonadales bacterium]|nr:serpin family protein [Gemmatimonadales bacterium]
MRRNPAVWALIVGAALGGACAPQARAQGAPATLTVRLRDERGQPTWLGFIRLEGSTTTAEIDSVGIAVIRNVAPGPVRLSIHALGYRQLDTAIVIRPGTHERLTVSLREEDFYRRIREEEAKRRAQQRMADSMRKANGGIDSVARGLVVLDTALTFGYERFGLNLLAAALDSTPRDSSRILSPLGAGQALAIAFLAARDSSARAIAGALRLGGMTAEELAARARRFLDMARRRRDLTLLLANALWVDTSATLDPRLQQVAGEQFSAAVRSLPLSSREAMAAVNHWADSTTAGRIPTIRKVPFDSSVKVVLTNAVYLKSLWLDPFSDAATKPHPFNAAGGHRLEVPTMERRATLAYRRGPGFQALRLPYAAGLTAMYLVLPDSASNPRSVLRTLAGKDWPAPDPRREMRDVHLLLPRLHIEQATDLLPPFRGLGMEIVADSHKADFRGLVVQRPGTPPLCPPWTEPQPAPCVRYRVSEARQNVYLDVDERGTEAAAVTALSFAARPTSVPPPPIEFVVDRPFLFGIRDERTGVLLFIGYVASPKQ